MNDNKTFENIKNNSILKEIISLEDKEIMTTHMLNKFTKKELLEIYPIVSNVEEFITAVFINKTLEIYIKNIYVKIKDNIYQIYLNIKFNPQERRDPVGNLVNTLSLSRDLHNHITYVDIEKLSKGTVSNKPIILDKNYLYQTNIGVDANIDLDTLELNIGINDINIVYLSDNILIPNIISSENVIGYDLEIINYKP